MKKSKKQQKRCGGCTHLYNTPGKKWLQCSVRRNRSYLTGGEFACKDFEPKPK